MRSKSSICIATYNGEQYIREQLMSILCQINDDDEIIVVDDCSIDNTVNIVRSINDSRINIYTNEVNKGHVFSFEKTISLAKNEIIFMSDQDDIWLENRYQLLKTALIENKVLLVSSNSKFIDAKGDELNINLISLRKKDSSKYFSNILNIILGKAGYYGCCMAFNGDLKKNILPFPSYIESHDLWIAMVANLKTSNLHLDENTLARRIHGSNSSVVKRKLNKKIKSRIVFFKSLIEIIYRKFENK
jgi:glycosyltransferase involved in cell wall biosynthesis